MKNLLITLLFTLIGITTYAQDSIRIDENGGFSQVITTKITAKKEYTYARSYFIGKINNYQSAVQIEDVENGKIVLKANKEFQTISDKLMGKPINYDGIEKFNITIDCKDNRFRIKVDAVRFTYDGFISMVSNGGNLKQRAKIFSHENEDYRLFIPQINNPEAFNKKRKEFFCRLVADLKGYMEQQANEDNF